MQKLTATLPTSGKWSRIGLSTFGEDGKFWIRFEKGGEGERGRGRGEGEGRSLWGVDWVNLYCEVCGVKGASDKDFLAQKRERAFK